jgi:hypothetical protein
MRQVTTRSATPVRNRVLRFWLWFVAIAGSMFALAGLAAVAAMPWLTMPPLPPTAALARITGVISQVRGNSPGTRRGEWETAKSSLLVQADDGKPSWILLDAGYFVARDLDRRCGFGDDNIDTLIGRRTDARVDGAARVLELRIGRILCVSLASAEREAFVGGQIRRRAYLYGPVLIVGGLLVAAAAGYQLGWLQRRTRAEPTADRD